MARITPNTGAGFVELEDHEAYKATLVKWEFENSTRPDGTPTRQLIADWQVEGTDEGDTTRDWIGMALGVSQQSGAPAKLRQLLNAVSKRDKSEPISWFDDETAEFAFDEDTSVLSEGMEVVFRGQNVQRKDGNGTRYNIYAYQMVKQQPAANGAGRKPKPQPAGGGAEQEPPF